MTITLETSHAAHIAHIRFARPPFNFASAELIGKIADAVDGADADPDIRCILLSSEGKSFCAGADLAGDAALVSENGMASINDLYTQAERLFRRRKPMVVAVQGAAIGAGLGLALTGDFRVASPGARFSANFVRLGFHPGFGLTVTLPRLIGVQRAAQMMLTADRVKPDTAVQWGLVDRICADDDVVTAAQAFAGEIAANAPLALVSIRATITSGNADRIVAAMRHEHAEQTILKATGDYKEGVASVFERRDAVFKGQ